MAQFFPAAFLPALNDSGVTISGATLTFYLTGTTTPKAVYSSPSLAVSLGSVITADSAGRFQDIWLDTATAYKVVLKDGSGNTIKTVDPVNVADGAASASIVEQTFTGDNSTTAFTVTGVYETNPANFLIHIDGVYQPISSSYSLSLVGANTRVTFTSAPPTGAVILIRAYSVAALGEAGPPATITWQFDTGTTDADPGAGKFRLNNATIASATEMYISETSYFGSANVAAWIQSWDDSTNTTTKGILTIRSIGALGYFGIFAVTGSIVDGGTYDKVSITHVSSTGTWTAGDEMSIDFAPSGNTGTDGRIPTVTAAGNAMIAAADAAAQTALLSVFTGDSGSGGVKGLVLAPAAGDATKFLRGDRTWATLASGSLNVQTFAAGGTWTKPANAQLSLIMLVGAGGGGGSGGFDTGTPMRLGGTGGGGGKLAIAFILSSSLGSTETVTIGTGGSGGTARSGSTLDGNDGSVGGTSTFGSWLSAFGGGGGGGGRSVNLVGGQPGGDMVAGQTGTTSANPTQTGGYTNSGSSGTATFGSGTPGGGNQSYPSAGLAGYNAINGPTGGGAGGGGLAAGGAGGALRGAAGGTAGAAGTNAGGAGNTSATHPVGSGGGGGGGHTTTNSSGGAGGAGVRGGGGGGGGSSTGGGTGASGAGGAGGDGYCVVYTWVFA